MAYMVTMDEKDSEYGYLVGGYLQGYFRATYSELKKIIGKHNDKGDGYKTSTQWIIKDTDTNEWFKIYDYKETSLYDPDLQSVSELRSKDEPHDWHIGCKTSPDKLIDYLKKRLKLIQGSTK